MTATLVRPDLFAGWTPEESWLAGLIWADGCLSEDGRVMLRTVDVELIRHAERISGAVAHQQIDSRPGRRPVWSVRFGAAAVVERLRERGLTPRKSLTAPFPMVPHRWDFVRGYFDGDGTVGLYRNPTAPNLRRLRSGFVGSGEFLDGLLGELRSVGIGDRVRVGRHSSIHRVQFNHADSLELERVMYENDDAPRLSRKRAIFAEGRGLLGKVLAWRLLAL